MVFFSKNRESAKKALKKLASEDKYYQGMDVKLAEKQIPHISGWKTWKRVRK